MSFPHHPKNSAGLLAILVLALPCFLPAANDVAQGTPMSPKTRSVQRIEYRGWPDSLLLSNGLVEAVVVPAIGRVMQLRFAGEPEGPFWENPTPPARGAARNANDWANFGGDKAWPCPQSDWRRIAGRDWPPPAAFDSRPMEATIEGSTAVALLSPIDSGYGIRVRRRIELSPDQPVMTITTTYEKIAGPPVDVAVWVITQLKDPVAVYALLPDSPLPGAGFVRQSEDLPANLKREKGLLSLTRDPHRNHKIGTLAGTLVWIGPNELVRIDSTLISGAKYPDDGCSAEIYTNADPMAYVELELLGPLARLAPGDKIERRSSYTLARRTAPDPEAEVRRLLAVQAGPSPSTGKRSQ